MRLDGVHAVIAQRRAIAASDSFVVGKILIGRWIDPPKGNVADAPLGASQDTVRQRRRQGFKEQIAQLHGDFPASGYCGGMPRRHHTAGTGADIYESIKTVIDWDIGIDEAF